MLVHLLDLHTNIRGHPIVISFYWVWQCHKHLKIWLRCIPIILRCQQSQKQIEAEVVIGLIMKHWISKHHPVKFAFIHECVARNHHFRHGISLCLFVLSALNSAATPHQTLLLLYSPLQFEKEHSLQSSAAHAWLRPVMQLNKKSHCFPFPGFQLVSVLMHKS